MASADETEERVREGARAPRWGARRVLFSTSMPSRCCEGPETLRAIDIIYADVLL